MKPKWMIGVLVGLALVCAACQGGSPGTAEPTPVSETAPSEQPIRVEELATEQPTEVEEPADDQEAEVEEPTPEQNPVTDPSEVITPGFYVRYECVEMEAVTDFSRGSNAYAGWQISETAQGCGTVPEEWTSVSCFVESVDADGEITLTIEVDESETEAGSWSLRAFQDDTFVPPIEFWAPMNGRVFMLEGFETNTTFRSVAEFTPVLTDQTEAGGIVGEIQVYEGLQTIEAELAPGEPMKSILALRVVFHRHSGLLLHSEEIQIIVECEACDPSVIGSVTRRKAYELTDTSYPGLEDIALPQLDDIVLPEVEKPVVEDRPTRSASEQVLFSLPDPPTGTEYFVSADGRHLVSSGYDFSQEDVMGHSVFALDGKPLSTPTDLNSCFDFVISADGGRAAYICSTGIGEHFVYSNGTRVGGPYFSVAGLSLSQDGEHLAYEVVPKGGSPLFFLDGQSIGAGSDLALSPDGTRLAYSVHRGRDEVVVIDGVEGKPYTNVGFVTFSPDSQRVAYIARIVTLGETGRRVVVDGVESGLHTDVRAFTFSGESQHFAYLAQEGEQWYVYLDGEQIAGPYEWLLNDLTFSPDGEKLSYISSEREFGTERWTVFAHLGKGLTVEYPDFARPSSLTFSPDGEQFAFLAADPDPNVRDSLVVINGEIIARHPSGTLRALTFSPGGEHLAYLVEEQWEFDPENLDPVLAWAGPYGFGLWYVVVDEMEGNFYNGIFVPEASIVFDSENQFHYLALKPPFSGDDPDAPDYDAFQYLLVEETLE